ncbi:MAG: asparagine synthetase B family protein, partial [Allosphingosinicella sp.]
WGEEALDHLAGDFAFAFFDRRESRLLLARDPLGQRPLFWHRGDGFVAFASMPKGLHALDLAPRLDLVTLAQFVDFSPRSGPGSFHQDIDRVEPGHCVTVRSDGWQSRRYWRPKRRELRLGGFDDYVEAFRSELDRAVASRLRGAGETVAAHLSGGWDSSAVAATAARLQLPSGARVVAFTAVPRERDARAPGSRFADEGPLAAATAALHPNLEHRQVAHPDRSPLADLARADALFQRPLFNPCNHVWLSQIRTQARASGARVLLTGEIGNWTISASPARLLADHVRMGRWGHWAREAAAMIGSGEARVRGVAAASFGHWLPSSVLRHLGRFSSGREDRWLTALHPQMRAATADQPAPGAGDHFQTVVDALAGMDFGEYRKGVLGGWGIDKRDATADVRLIEFCLSLPIDMLLRNGVRRPLARAALADRLPAAVLDHRSKGYQAAEWHQALTRDLPTIRRLIEAIAADPIASSVIDAELLRRLVGEWPDEGWERPATIAIYRAVLLHSLAAGHFMLGLAGERTSSRSAAGLGYGPAPERDASAPGARAAPGRPR